MMRKIIMVCFTAALTSCATQPLYYWGKIVGGTSNYEHLSYSRYDKDTPKVMCRTISLYEDMLKNTGGSRQMPPPGICAEYAHMLLQEDIMKVFNEHANKEQKKKFEQSPYGADAYTKAMNLFEKEIELYPESTKFINSLIARFKK